jgi:hypothetical protein
MSELMIFIMFVKSDFGVLLRMFYASILFFWKIYCGTEFFSVGFMFTHIHQFRIKNVEDWIYISCPIRLFLLVLRFSRLFKKSEWTCQNCCLLSSVIWSSLLMSWHVIKTGTYVSLQDMQWWNSRKPVLFLYSLLILTQRIKQNKYSQRY